MPKPVFGGSKNLVHIDKDRFFGTFFSCALWPIYDSGYELTLLVVGVASLLALIEAIKCETYMPTSMAKLVRLRSQIEVISHTHFTIFCLLLVFFNDFVHKIYDTRRNI